jgi:hypothetical protein
MKGILFFLTACAAILLGACANTELQVDQVGSKLERGLRGQGQIVPNDPLKDSFGQEFN